MVNFFDPPTPGGQGYAGDPARFFDPLVDPEEEERRRLLMLGQGAQMATPAGAAPQRVADMLGGTPAPAASAAFGRDFTQAMGNQFDAQGRAVPMPTPEQSLALSPFNPFGEPEGRAAAADAYVRALVAYQQSPPNEAMLAVNPDAAPGAGPQAGARADFSDAAGGSPFGDVQPDGTVLGPDGVLLSPEGAIIQRTGAGEGAAPNSVRAGSFINQGGRPAGQPAATPAEQQPQEERRAVGPGFGGNDALIDAVLAGNAQPTGHTDANPEGITWPILGQLEDPLGRTYTLVQTGAGAYLVWDPRTEQYYPAGDLETWTTRRKAPAGITAI